MILRIEIVLREDIEIVLREDGEAYHSFGKAAVLQLGYQLCTKVSITRL